jgi:hypothetical protein
MRVFVRRWKARAVYGEKQSLADDLAMRRLMTSRLKGRERKSSEYIELGPFYSSESVKAVNTSSWPLLFGPLLFGFYSELSLFEPLRKGRHLMDTRPDYFMRRSNMAHMALFSRT